ncbi:hypothetical protein ACE38W_21915 [Chitinophaga sp. Hz27]|uniref:hypothetical protein n=1 Tax=Chitinophaga sp. Hz27 TaxID=3347169 RepID=UPI0035DB8CD6
MADKFIRIYDNVNQTGEMNQFEMQAELKTYIDRELYANLSQALNDVADGRGSATGSKTFNGYPVLHASAGKIGRSSITLFWYEKDRNHYIIAMGEHANSTTYDLTHYGQIEGDFRLNNRITIV